MQKSKQQLLDKHTLSPPRLASHQYTALASSPARNTMCRGAEVTLPVLPLEAKVRPSWRRAAPSPARTHRPLAV